MEAGRGTYWAGAGAICASSCSLPYAFFLRCKPKLQTPFGLGTSCTQRLRPSAAKRSVSPPCGQGSPSCAKTPASNSRRGSDVGGAPVGEGMDINTHPLGDQKARELMAMKQERVKADATLT